ncbi:MAG: HD domain-containing protein [Thermoguttaceae bacterium]|nr:HD domain-containing protein [Thermoguttaceae bacterium]MDW8077856.1 HD domain-containing protein [Thermoguttaceae bacterium]
MTAVSSGAEPVEGNRLEPPLLLARAAGFAAAIHAEQRRKLSSAPYLGHLFRVAGLVLEYGGSLQEAAAALLHDAVEDQGGLGTWEQIRQQFGEEIAGWVLALSDRTARPAPPWRERKERFIASLPHTPLPVRRIALCDKIDNLQSLLAEYRSAGEAVWQEFRGGKEGSVWYFQEILRVLESTAGDAGFQAGLAVYRQLVAELNRLVLTSP